MKPQYLKKKSGVPVVIDYVDQDTLFSNFMIEYLCGNENFATLFLPVYMGPRSNLLI